MTGVVVAGDGSGGVEEAALEGVGGGGGVAGQPAAQRGAEGLGQDGEHDVEVDVEVTAADSASALKAWMISARRCSMVIRRAYDWMTCAGRDGGSSLVIMTVGCVVAQAGDDELADGPG